MESISLLDQIKSKYIKNAIFGFIEDETCRKLTIYNKNLLNVFKHALAAVTEKKFGIPDWPKYPDLLNNVSEDAFKPKVLADKLNILNWPKYSETIYATVKFMANKIFDDYAKKLNNGYDNFLENLKIWFAFYKELGLYNGSLEKGGAEYFNETAKPYAIKVVIYLLLIEIIDLGCKKKLFSVATLDEYLKEHPKEKSKDINRWFNSLIYRIIYNALEESLKDKVDEEDEEEESLNDKVDEENVLKVAINRVLCEMALNCLNSTVKGYIGHQAEYQRTAISGWLRKKFNSGAKYSKDFKSNLCFWYIKMMFKEEKKEKDDYDRCEETVDQALQDLKLSIFSEEKIDYESVAKLIKKDSSFSFLSFSFFFEKEKQALQPQPKLKRNDEMEKRK